MPFENFDALLPILPHTCELLRRPAGGGSGSRFIPAQDLGDAGW
jgi:hypothetical protein